MRDCCAQTVPIEMLHSTTAVKRFRIVPIVIVFWFLTRRPGIESPDVLHKTRPVVGPEGRGGKARSVKQCRSWISLPRVAYFFRVWNRTGAHDDCVAFQASAGPIPF